MSHLPNLIRDLALILGAAGITTLLFRRLKQPVVLGYIIAGLLVGPNFSLFPTVTDVEGIRTWAEIGVIFLLFALGLEFSFKKLAKIGGTAGITGTIEILAMLSIGFGMGQLMSWSFMDSLFLGGIIAISSTTIIFRAFEELGIKTKQFTGLVMGVLIVEDLVAVLLMVLLSTLAASQQVEGGTLLLALGKLLFFLCLWFVAGIFWLPTLLKKNSRWLNNETLLLTAIALCLGMVVFADKVGFSAAFGAFVMGSILGETVYAEKIEYLLQPVKNLFGAIFFVSVGMLINPVLLWQNIGPVLLLSAIVIVGKIVFVAMGALVAGRPLNQAIQAGTSMTQIGEFSFIIATLGVTLNVTSSFLYPIAVGVSVLTTFTTPYMIRLSNPLIAWLEKILPTRWQQKLREYSAGTQVLKGESDWRIVLRLLLQMLLINSVVIIALLMASKYLLYPFMLTIIDTRLVASLVTILITLMAMLPFVWALMAKKIQHRAYQQLWLNSKYNRGPLVAVEIFRNVLAIAFVAVLLAQHFILPIAMGITIVVIGIVMIVFHQRLQRFYHRIEQRFLNNLHEKENAVKEQSSLLTPWDAHLSKLRICATSPFIGKTLEELALREQYGVNIAYIERGNQLLYAPTRNEKLFPYDEIGVIGSDAQLQQFTQLTEEQQEEAPIADALAQQISLEKIVVDEHNGLHGKTIRNSGIREKTKGLVVGIERNGERILNPSSDTVFEWHDVVWVVGDRQKIAELNKS